MIEWLGCGVEADLESGESVDVRLLHQILTLLVQPVLCRLQLSKELLSVLHGCTANNTAGQGYALICNADSYQFPNFISTENF